MASAAKLSDDRVLHLPRGTGDDHTATFAAGRPTKFVAQEGDEITQVGETAPSAFRLHVSPRQCGDWYSEIQGKDRHVAAIGSNKVEAARNAIAKFGAGA